MGESYQENVRKDIFARFFDLRRQITIVYVLVMAFTIGVAVVLFNVFIERFYLYEKEHALVNIYRDMNEEAAAGLLKSGRFSIDLENYSAINNASIIIITENYDTIQIYSNEPEERLLFELKDNMLGFSTYKELLYKTEDIVMVRKEDTRTGKEYLEMWGELSDSSLFLMRSAMDSIRKSADIAIRLLAGIGSFSIVLGATIIYLTTRRISSPIREITEISERVSNMDFTAKYEGRETNEIGKLGHSINKMSTNLEEAISELKEANLELQKDIGEKEKIDALRKEFVASVSHELKTPIAIIQGYAEGLKEDMDNLEDREYYCGVIIDEAQKMNNMVKRLLTLSQLEAGSSTITIDRFDICAMIDNVVVNSAVIAKKHNIELTIEKHAPIYVWADEFKIEEVFTNYFSNAVKYCGEEEPRCIDVSYEMLENKVRVNVFNTGAHITDEEMEHIWERFYKADKSHNRKMGGTGIGLSIVKAIMEAHKQDYGVENKDNGVNFYFTLDCSNK
jgi:signal transduction histidine kinase